MCEVTLFSANYDFLMHNYCIGVNNLLINSYNGYI